MKTSIVKQHNDGFKLTEQDVRRLYQIMVDAAAKVSDTSKAFFFVKTQNGTIIEPSTLDEVFQLDNVGERSIEIIYFSLGPTTDKTSEDHQGDDPWRMRVRFERVQDLNRSSAIYTEVNGEQRDWVVLVAGEMEDRIKSIRRLAPAKWLLAPGVPVLVTLMMLALAGVLLILFAKPAPAYLELERLYSAGKVSNPIEAMIALERARQSRSIVDAIPGIMFLVICFAMAFSFGIPALVRRFGSPYVFHWGDFVAVYERRRNVIFIVWTVVVLGVVVGVASAYLSKLMGI